METIGQSNTRRRAPDGRHVEVKLGSQWRRRVEVNRPMIQQITPAGMAVCMYLDEPGFYWTIGGDPVPEKVAASAGYDIVALAEKRAINADKGRIQAAMAQVKEPPAQREVIEAAGPYEVQSVGPDQAIVLRDGVALM